MVKKRKFFPFFWLVEKDLLLRWWRWWNIFARSGTSSRSSSQKRWFPIGQQGPTGPVDAHVPGVMGGHDCRVQDRESPVSVASRAQLRRPWSQRHKRHLLNCRQVFPSCQQETRPIPMNYASFWRKKQDNYVSNAATCFQIRNCHGNRWGSEKKNNFHVVQSNHVNFNPIPSCQNQFLAKKWKDSWQVADSSFCSAVPFFWSFISQKPKSTRYSKLFSIVIFSGSEKNGTFVWAPGCGDLGIAKANFRFRLTFFFQNFLKIAFTQKTKL